MMMQVLRHYLRPHKLSIAAIVLLQIVQAAATLYLPALNADIIDQGVVAGDTGYIVRFGAVMLAITVLQVLCAIGALFFSARTAMSIGHDLRSAVFDRVQSFSGREVGLFGTASLVTRTTNDVQQVQMLVLATFTTMVSAPLMGVGGIIMALDQDLPLSLILLAAIPLLGFVVGAVIRRMRPVFGVMQDRIDAVNRVLREQILGIRVIRAFVRSDYERRRFERANTALADASVRAGRLTTLMFPMLMTMVNVITVPVVWFGAHRIDSGGMRIGALTAFLSYLMQILISVNMATSMFIMLPRAEVCARRIGQVLGTESSVRSPDEPVRTFTTRSGLELRGIQFGYPGAEKPVLSGVDLIARPGTTTAVVGSTGSGKSTLLGLVSRIFDPTAGEVLVNDTNVARIAPELLSRTIGLVPQKAHLLSGTVASNLRYGKDDATDDELWRALETAQAKEFVELLEGGLEAPISQGGSNVSGGQRQRLAIARVLVGRPEIYLLDDSFSALDPATEAALRAAMVAETAGATIINVTRRVSSFRDADCIVVLDEGKIVGSGTHLKLMSSNKIYRDIVLSQVTEEEAARR
ncbi:ABC transporter ATP-binding protein [Streptomyces sp. SPB162]|uniref:ABC transporter ATP-binding protein n=1 Tax=Streptomyces sp. SPB162 TaxID=2940560 RepID=UPI0024060C74|nr:ABC transporter ATP-binding protein [Streptomyces sp. SPB162]MDF9811449.1 ATP-binding cassette subfamily B multidrug efflux pump [Streptomyces sp. SPB162]